MKLLSSDKLCFFLSLLVIVNQSFAQVEIVIKPDSSSGKDAYVNTFYSKLGSTQSFIASAWTYGGVEGIGRSFIQFQLPELPDDYINFKACLNLYYDYSSQHVGHGGDNSCLLQRVTEDWDEDQIDWNNQPDVSSIHSVTLPASLDTDQSYPNIDVTELVMDMYRDPRHSFGFRLSLLDEQIYRSMILASSDHPDERIRPSLIIRYDICTLPLDEYSYEVKNLFCQFSYADSTATSWHWDFGNGYGSTLQNPSYYYTEAGIYYVCLKVENQCGIVTICDSIEVCSDINPDFNFSVENLNVTFTNLTNDGNNYYWDFGNGFFSTIEEPEFQYYTSGEYLVCLSASNNCSTDTICKTVIVERKLGLNSFDVNNTVKLYPNPAKDYVLIQAFDVELLNVEIYNAMGLFVSSVTPKYFQNNYRISLQGNAPGLYLLKLRTNTGTITNRLIIQ
ncbi:MAG: DNRLRE domain-containing protein [Lentimicrobiaceae bacterium]|nr:DNRLRE domain-containing protein [Lentimicrobiaceae bacterium]